jgi:hypothetical protein
MFYITGIARKDLAVLILFYALKDTPDRTALPDVTQGLAFVWNAWRRLLMYGQVLACGHTCQVQ